MKTKFFIILIIILFLTGADKKNENEKVLNKIKIYNDDNHVKPKLINLDDKKKLTLFPEDHNFIMWKTGYRGFHIKDKDTGKEGYLVCGGGNTDLNNAFVVDKKNKIILLDIYEHGMDKGQSYYILYNADKMKEIKTIFVPSSFIFPFYGKLLICEFIKGSKNLSWYITDIYFENKEENGLTKLLTEKQILFHNKGNLEKFHSDCVNINYKKNIIIGCIEEKGYTSVIVFIKWDKNFNVIKYEPVFDARYGENQYIDEVQICKNGSWLKWSEHTPIESRYSKIIFHKISDEFEEGISPPVYAGTFDENISGDFFIHKKYGAAYGLYDPELGKNIILYTYNDFKKALYKKNSEKNVKKNNDKKENKDEELINIFEEDYYKIADNGNKIISLNKDKNIIRIYNITDYENFKLTGNNYKITDKIFKFTASNDLKYIAFTNWENEICIYKYNEQKRKLENFKNWNGSKEKISYLCFSPDNKYLAAGNVNDSVKIWNLEGKIKTEIKNLSSYVNKICFSYDSKIIAFSTDDETAYFYDIDGNRLAKILLYYDQTVHKFSPSGDYFICGKPKDKSINKIKLNDKVVKLIFSETDKITFSPDETHYAVNFKKYGISLKTINDYSINSIYGYPWMITGKNWNNTIKKWFKKEGFISTHFYHSDEINTITLSPDENFTATGSSDNYIRLYDNKLNMIRTFKKNICSISKIVFSNDGKHIASGDTSGIINIYDLNGNKLKTLSGFINPVTGIIFNSLDENITAWNENKLIIFDKHGEAIKIFTDDKNNPDNIGYIFGALKNDMLIFYIKENEDNKYVSIMDINGKIINKIKSNLWGYLHNIGKNKFAVSSRGMGSIDDVKIFDYKGKLLKRIEGYRNEDDPVVSSSDGILTAIAFSREYKIKIYNENFELIREFYNFENINSMIFSNDNKELLIACKNGLKTVSIDQNREIPDYFFKIDIINENQDTILKVPEHFCDQLEFSAISYDGKYIITGDRNTILILDSKTFNEIKKIETAYNITSIDMSRDNKYIALVDDERKIVLLDFITGNELFFIHAHKGDITDLIITNDSKYLISAGEDHTVIVWDINEKKEIKRFKCEDPDYLSVSENNTYISCQGDDRTFIWDLKSGELSFTLPGYYNIAISKDEKTFAYFDYSYNYEDYYKILIFDLIEYNNDDLEDEKAEGGPGPVDDKIINTGKLMPYDIKISNDKTKIISWLSNGYNENKICVWDLDTQELLYEKDLSGEQIKSFSIANNDTFLTGFESLKLFNINTGNLINVMKPLQNNIEDICFSRNGKYLITGHRWGVFLYWDLENQKLYKRFYPNGSIPYSLLLSHDGKYAVCNGNVNTIKEIWDIDKKNKTGTIYEYTDLLDFSPDNRYLMVKDTDDYFTLMDLQTGKTEKLLPGKLGEEIKYASLSDDGKTLISVYNKGPVILWDFENRKKIKQIDKTTNYFSDIAATKDYKKIYLITGKKLYLYDFDKMSETQILKNDNLHDYKNSIYLSKDEKYLLLISLNSIYIYDIKKDEIKYSIKNEKNLGNILGAIISEENKEIISVHSKGYIKYWNLEEYDIRL